MVLYFNYNDEQLLQLLKAGDEAAFTELYERYWQRVYAVGYYFSRQKEAAEEMVQQVFMSLWERREQLVITGSVEGYLATAAKYNVLDARMKQSRRQVLLRNVPLPSPTAEGDAEQVLQARILEAFLQGEVEKLPEMTRIIFKYSRQEHLSIVQIADRLNISPKTVEAHITKALKTLRLSLRDLRIWFF